MTPPRGAALERLPEPCSEPASPVHALSARGDALADQDAEFDIPGEVPESRVLGAAFEDGPRRRPVDTLLATFNSFFPPLGAAAALALWLSGWYRISWVEVGIFATMHVLTITGVEVGFHRLFTHGSFRAHRGVRIALALMGSLAFQGPVIWWAYVHRKHHRFSDRSGDPHSMYLSGAGFWNRTRGFVHAHMGWIWNPHSIRSPNWRGYVRDLHRDPDLLLIQVHYLRLVALGFSLPALAGGLLHMSWKGAFLGFLFGGPVRMFVSNHLSYFGINSVSHLVGARPYCTADNSTNSIPLLFAVPTMGQSYHNNHHAFPSSWRVGHRWYEVDLGAYVLVVLRALGLAWGFREPTRAQMLRKRRRA